MNLPCIVAILKKKKKKKTCIETIKCDYTNSRYNIDIKDELKTVFHLSY
jgi:hypothetical protein